MLKKKGMHRDYAEDIILFRLCPPHPISAERRYSARELNFSVLYIYTGMNIHNLTRNKTIIG